MFSSRSSTCHYCDEILEFSSEVIIPVGCHIYSPHIVEVVNMSGFHVLLVEVLSCCEVWSNLAKVCWVWMCRVCVFFRDCYTQRKRLKPGIQSLMGAMPACLSGKWLDSADANFLWLWALFDPSSTGRPNTLVNLRNKTEDAMKGWCDQVTWPVTHKLKSACPHNQNKHWILIFRNINIKLNQSNIHSLMTSLTSVGWTVWEM